MTPDQKLKLFYTLSGLLSFFIVRGYGQLEKTAAHFPLSSESPPARKRYEPCGQTKGESSL